VALQAGLDLIRPLQCGKLGSVRLMARCATTFHIDRTMNDRGAFSQFGKFLLMTLQAKIGRAIAELKLVV
jgi:hypothetical protein